MRGAIPQMVGNYGSQMELHLELICSQIYNLKMKSGIIRALPTAAQIFKVGSQDTYSRREIQFGSAQIPLNMVVSYIDIV